MKTLTKHTRDAALQPLSPKTRIDLQAICTIARRLDERMAIPATSSNFSLRADGESFYISRSGMHKRDLNPSDFLKVNAQGEAFHRNSPKPSDETLLHAMLYRNNPNLKCVLHVHAPELEKARGPHHKIDGHELLKAIGKKGHDEDLWLHVFENSQDMAALSTDIENKLFKTSDAPLFFSEGFILQQHGIYCAGHSISQAEMRLEAILHLMASQ